MAKLETMEKVVLQILEENELARMDDYVLMYEVVYKLNGEEVLNRRFGQVLFHHDTLNLPKWETVTRCRRKIQEKRPDLVDPEKAKFRNKEEKAYREYSRT